MAVGTLPQTAEQARETDNPRFAHWEECHVLRKSNPMFYDSHSSNRDYHVFRAISQGEKPGRVSTAYIHRDSCQFHKGIVTCRVNKYWLTHKPLSEENFGVHTSRIAKLLGLEVPA